MKIEQIQESNIMKIEQIQESNIMKIELSKVTKSYTGRVGCMCGCIGRYVLPSHVNIAAENEKVGYESFSESDVSDHSVKSTVTKINRALAMSEDERNDNGISVVINEVICSIEVNGRNNTVYMN